MKHVKYIYVPEEYDVDHCWYVKLSNDLYWVILDIRPAPQRKSLESIELQTVNFFGTFTSNKPTSSGKDDFLFKGTNSVPKGVDFVQFPHNISLEEINMYLLKISME